MTQAPRKRPQLIIECPVSIAHMQCSLALKLFFDSTWKYTKVPFLTFSSLPTLLFLRGEKTIFGRNWDRTQVPQATTLSISLWLPGYVIRDRRGGNVNLRQAFLKERDRLKVPIIASSTLQKRD